MFLNKLTLIAFLAVPVAGLAAERSVCPASLKEKSNVLLGARLFDGPQKFQPRHLSGLRLQERREYQYHCRQIFPVLLCEREEARFRVVREMS